MKNASLSNSKKKTWPMALITSAEWTPLDVYIGKLVLVAVVSWLIIGAAVAIWHYTRRGD